METEQEVPPGGPNEPHVNEPEDDFFGEDEQKTAVVGEEEEPAPDRSLTEAAAEAKAADGDGKAEDPKFDPVTQTAAAPPPAETPADPPPADSPAESSGKTPVRTYKILQESELTKETLQALLKELDEDGAKPRTALFLLGELTDRQPDTAKKAAYRKWGPWPQFPKLAAVPERYLDPRIVKPKPRQQPDDDLVIE